LCALDSASGVRSYLSMKVHTSKNTTATSSSMCHNQKPTRPAQRRGRERKMLEGALAN